MKLTKKIANRWRSGKEALVLALFEWVPLPLGRVLRKVAYRAILGRIGKGVHIQPSVELVNTDRIEIGNRVRIDRYARLRNVGRDSRICIGDGVKINRGADIKVHCDGNGYIEIGENTIIGAYSCMSGLHVKIGKDCLIAPHVGIFANNHVFADPRRKIREQKHTYKGIVIGDDCWLGSGVKVMDGVTIGEGSVIGAGAVVTKSIPPYSIAVGVPAKVVGKRDDMSDKSVDVRVGESTSTSTETSSASRNGFHSASLSR